jgi:hypothetical protein
MPGQRKNTKLLTDGELDQIQALLGLPPITRATPAQTPGQAPVSKPERRWRGTTDAAFRAKLVSELESKLAARLAKELPDAQYKAGLPKIELTILEAAGHEAKAAVNEVFAEWTAQAPLTQSALDRRRNHQFTASGPDPNILDVANPADRQKGGFPVNGRDTAKHMVANDDACKKVMTQYAFDPYTGTDDEAICLSSEVLDPFYAANKDNLDECDRLGYWMANPDLGVVFAPRYLAGWDPKDGDNVLAVWERKAVAYQKLIHEYIHVLQHPLVPYATSPTGQNPPRGTNTVKEGVCEYLTTKVMTHLARKPVDELDAIAVRFEGSPAGSGRGSALRASLQKYAPPSDYTDAVDKVRQAIAVMGSDNGLLAAFFQGHTEYIGRYYTRKWLDGVLESSPGGPRSMPFPEIFESLDALAAATGRGVDQIRKDNPKLTPAPPFGGQQIHLPGFHGHLMIVDTSGDEEACETWAMISAQHDIPADRIQQLNGNPDDMPARAWILAPDS